MASKKAKKYLIKTPNSNYCGVGAGGVQFAYGQAEVLEGWVCEWYKERGYEVVEIKEPEEEKK